jgi:heterodisulfide reductase subunit B
MRSAAERAADLIITACPLCMYNLNENGTVEVPVHYFTEILAQALGETTGEEKVPHAC